MLLYVTRYSEELISHFCQLEDIIEHISDKNGRVLTAQQVQNYAFLMAVQWYPQFYEMYDYRIVTPKLHEFLHLLISTVLDGKKYTTSSNYIKPFRIQRRQCNAVH